MNKYIEIAGRKIGPDYNPVVIAEMGINPGGNLEVAKAMVDSAYEAGIEIIKSQTHLPEEDIKIGNLEEKHFYDDAKKNIFTEEQERELKAYVESKGMIFLSAPFSFAAVDRLERMNIAAYKITSSEMDNSALVEYVASKRKPIILSTGMNNVEGVKKAVEIIRRYHDNFAIQHCTNIYPTPPDKIRLNSLKELEKAFPGVVLGLSDHSLNNYSCYAAMTQGASIVERHFTDKKDRPGKEIAWSMDQEEAKELVAFSKTINKMKAGKKELLKEEEEEFNDNKNKINVLITSKRLLKNSTISKADLTTKAVAKDGIPADELYKVIWKKIKKDLPQDYILKWEDIIWMKKRFILDY